MMCEESNSEVQVVGAPPTKYEGLIENESTCSGGSVKSDESPESLSGEVFAFHHSNIHERRLAAYLARAAPMVLFLTTVILSVLGIFWKPMLLLWTCAVLNVCMWLWLVSYAMFSLQSTWKSRREVAMAHADAEQGVADVEGTTDVIHLIALPNYKEDESILATTLTAIAQAQGSRTFRIVLAMEAREGPSATERADKLQERFAHRFSRFSIAFHSLGLTQEHLTGDSVPEVPGKSSNLKFAVQQAYRECVADGIDLSKVVLTAADADCIFHPGYFSQVGSEFTKLRLASNGGRCWSMWQAPQLPFRNYVASPSPSRIWGYVASMYETGGVGGLQFGGYHMTFSSFSLPLELVMGASPWDGDVIADDHHCYLKCFLYSVFHGLAKEAASGKGSKRINPPLRLRPVMLPVKSTSVEADNCLQSWTARFNQAKRHTQGVAEFSYVLLGASRLLRTLPCSSYSLSLLTKLLRVVLLPLCVNMLPICQSIPFAVQSLYWFYHGMGVPQCPSSALYKLDDPQFYFCWFAGGFNLAWPMLVPLGLVVLASYYMIAASFLEPAERKRSEINKEPACRDAEMVWENEDGRIPPACGSKRLMLFCYVLHDIFGMLPIVMPIYGVLPAILSYWNCLVRGNRFNFVSAAKGVAIPQPPSSTTRAQLQQSIRVDIVGQVHDEAMRDDTIV